MIPYTFVVLITWLVFFVIWFLLGIPMGPGYPARPVTPTDRTGRRPS